jgi:cytochrome P450
MTTTEPLLVVRRYPIADVCSLLGVPRRDWRLFCRWAGKSLNSKAFDELYAYIDVMIADRCRRSTDDLVSKLIELEVDGEELTVDDIRRFVAALGAGAN